MIVGTEGTETQVDESTEGSSSKATAKADAAKVAAPTALDASSSSGAALGDGEAAAATGSATPAATTSAQPDDPTQSVQQDLARADAMKPLEGPINDLYSADKQDARQKIQDAYEKALGDKGDLRTKLDNAHDDFDQAAAKMLPNLGSFVGLFAAGSELGSILSSRQKVRADLDSRTGKNEKARSVAQETNKKWAAAFADWSAPSDKLAALVASYADKIETLKSDATGSSSPNAAMLSFWLEVAPKHLQATDRPLSADAQKAVAQVSSALQPYGLDTLLKPGKDRGDGSLYVVAPGDLQKTRVNVLQSWIAAARAQADAEAGFKINPDDSATLSKQWDTLKDDQWLQQAKKQPLDASA